MTLLLCRRTPYHTCLDCRQIPRTWPYKSPWRQADEVGEPAAASSTLAEKPRSKELTSRDASTQTEGLLENGRGRTHDVSTQTRRVRLALDAGCQVDAETMAVKETGTVPTEVASKPPRSAAVMSAADDSVAKKYTADRNSTICSSWHFWKKRYLLFSRFELGVMLDEDCFYSVCPEVLAVHMASRCTYRTVVDPFCGAGSIAIQLALRCRKVIAVDIDPAKIKLARENAMVYGVSPRIDFRVGDSYKILSGVKADAVVTSPPWFGQFHTKDIGSEKEGGLAGLLKMAYRTAPRVVLQLPKTIDRTQCLKLSRKAKFGRVEFEDVIINGYPNSMNMYIKSRQNDCPLGPAISSKVILKFPKYRRNRNDDLGSYKSYLCRTAKFLATH